VPNFYYIKFLQTALSLRRYQFDYYRLKEERDRTQAITETKHAIRMIRNELFSKKQYLSLYTKKLWEVHLIRQDLLQHSYTILRAKQVLETVKNSRKFKKDEIYEHHLIGNQLYSWNRFRILGSIDHEQIYTLPGINEEMEDHWNPGKLVALITGTLAAGTALLYGAYNFFLTNHASNADVYAEITLDAINNHTWK